MKTKYTTEELKGFTAQPEDSCPHFNDIIQNLQRMVNNKDVSFEDRVIENLKNALNVVERIEKWSDDWSPSFLSFSDDSITNAYVYAAEEELKKSKKIDLNKCNNHFLEVFKNDFIGIINDLSFKDEDIVLTDNELQIDRLFLNMKKVELNEIVENMREYAKSKRAYTNYMKEGYKNESMINDLNDIIQPEDIIEEQMKKNDKTYNLGVIFSEQSNNKLVKDNIINDVDLFIIDKMDNKNKKNIIIEALDKKGFKKISYYKDLNDLRNGKGYNTEKIQSKVKLKNKNK